VHLLRKTPRRLHRISSALQDQLVATYAIGWAMTEEMITEYPQIKPAAAEDDTGVVVSFERLASAFL